MAQGLRLCAALHRTPSVAAHIILSSFPRDPMVLTSMDTYTTQEHAHIQALNLKKNKSSKISTHKIMQIYMCKWQIESTH